MADDRRRALALVAEEDALPVGIGESEEQALGLLEERRIIQDGSPAKAPPPPDRRPRGAERAWASRVEAAKLALLREGVAQLDESEELSGMGRAYDASALAGRSVRTVRDRRKRGDGKPGRRAPKPKAASAVGTEKEAPAPRRATAMRPTSTPTRPEAGAAAKAAGSASGKGAVAGLAAPALGILAGAIVFVLAALILSQLAGALLGFWDAEEKRSSLAGLPPYITYEMVEEALECQEEYGHPAGCTIAQIVVESGMGDHLSQLATADHNLFGMKWSSAYAGCPEVSGKSSWVTREEYGGQSVTITDQFISFTGDAECIRFRSRVFLQSQRYAGNPLIREAISSGDSDKMAEGLKDAGWATDSSYVEALTAVMDAYGLRRFDSMTPEDFRSGYANADSIVKAAFSQLGVPYVWGGATPGVALDCSGLTQYCYAQAGIRISHYTEYQREELEAIPLSQAQPGDILYKSGHVAIFIGGDRYIHAPHAGAVVCIAAGKESFTCALTARR